MRRAFVVLSTAALFVVVWASTAGAQTDYPADAERPRPWFRSSTDAGTAAGRARPTRRRSCSSGSPPSSSGSSWYSPYAATTPPCAAPSDPTRHHCVIETDRTRPNARRDAPARERILTIHMSADAADSRGRPARDPPVLARPDGVSSAKRCAGERRPSFVPHDDAGEPVAPVLSSTSCDAGVQPSIDSSATVGVDLEERRPDSGCRVSPGRGAECVRPRRSPRRTVDVAPGRRR